MKAKHFNRCNFRSQIGLIIILFVVLNSVSFSQLKLKINSEIPSINFSKNISEYSTLLLEKDTTRNHSLLNILGQAAAGPACAIVFSIIPLSAGFGYAWSGDKNPSVEFFYAVAFYSAYIIGSATGVYWIANFENKNIAYWKTVKSAFLGGAIGTAFAIIQAKSDRISNTEKQLIFLAMMSPTIGAMIYTNYEAEWTAKEEFPIKEKLTHKDIFNSENMININLFQVNVDLRFLR